MQYAVGGNDAVSVGSLATAMIGVHPLIGIGEGIITALAVGSVMAMRPDLVYGARAAPRRLSTPAFVGVGIVTAVLLVVFVAPFANPNPDGLERVAADNGVDAAVHRPRLRRQPAGRLRGRRRGQRHVRDGPRRHRRHRGHVGRRRRRRLDRPPAARPLGAAGGRIRRADGRPPPAPRPPRRRAAPSAATAVQAAGDAAVRLRRRGHAEGAVLGVRHPCRDDRRRPRQSVGSR